MATADSGQSSAMATSSNKVNRGHSPPAQSKRERKKQLIAEKLAVLNDQWGRDRDRSYREELQKIQVDLNLVQRVDPYADRPLDAIQREIRELSQVSNNGADRTNRTLLEMAGPSFQDWVEQVADLVETRDYEVTTQKHEHDRRTQNHRNTFAYKVEVARREHKALSATLKDRLMNAITSKKMRLSREKEALEISDSSALFLHPNQFTLTNPASPGGTHHKTRTTRLRREMEDPPIFSENKKRKRNAADDDGSPAPNRRVLDASNTTPLWQNDRIRAMRKETGPVYSIDKLFTDKELSMNYNTAALAAYKHLITRRDANGNVIPSPDESEVGNGDGNEDEKDEDLSAVTMERQPSHQTRSTRGQNNNQNWYDDKIMGIEGLANFELAGNLDKMGMQEPKLPPLIHSQYSKAYVKSESNTPMALSQDDAQNDITVMNVFKSYQRSHGVGSNLETPNGGRRVLENMTQPQQSGRNYVAWLQSQRPSADQLADSLGVPSSSIRDDHGPGGSFLSGIAPGIATGSHASPAAPPMSRQSSFGGGAAMSRSGSGRGRRRG
ncbi:Sds3-like-domain-containing protein [Xylariales sp. AK1849]|nr:Sds3-like-domain-containing protein [Xylariales sp. AK1849]